jgi:hypothetical protein
MDEPGGDFWGFPGIADLSLEMNLCGDLGQLGGVVPSLGEHTLLFRPRENEIRLQFPAVNRITRERRPSFDVFARATFSGS